MENSTELVENTRRKFNCTPEEAVKITVHTIEFMLLYNPCPVNPKPRKKEYHDYWESILRELK